MKSVILASIRVEPKVGCSYSEHEIGDGWVGTGEKMAAGISVPVEYASMFLNMKNLTGVRHMGCLSAKGKLSPSKPALEQLRY